MPSIVQASSAVCSNTCPLFGRRRVPTGAHLTLDMTRCTYPIAGAPREHRTIAPDPLTLLVGNLPRVVPDQ